MHDHPRDLDGEASPDADPRAFVDDEAPEPGRPGFLQVAMSLIAKISRALLGSERHEMLAVRPPVEAEVDVPSGPELIAPPLLVFFRSLQTRVGIAAVLSFAVLVGAFIVRNGWIGKNFTIMAMKQPGETPTPDDKAKDDAEKKKVVETGTGVDPASKDNKGTTPPPPSSGQTPPAAPASPEPGLGNPSHAPATVPPPVAEGSEPAAVLGGGAGALPATLPPSSTTTPRLPDVPSPGVEPMPELLPPPGASNPVLAQAPAASAPASASVPSPEPTPPPSPTPEPAAPPATDTRPKEPGGAAGLPPLGELPTMSPPGATTESVPELPEAPAPPITPASPSPDRMATAPASGPVRTETPPTLEKVPPGSLESSATKTSTAGMPGGGRWLTIPSGGRRLVGAVPIVSTPAEVQVDAPKVTDGPRFSDDLAVADQVEPVVHTVEPGENFWTISKLYYRSGRFFKALHAANRKQVPDIRQLWVGTVLRIPPPEALDRSLIDPPDRKSADEPAPSLVRRTTKQADPVDAADLGVPPRRRPVVVDPDPEAAATPRRPTYKVKPYETLRSIARDTLNDPRRDREIYNLNRDVLEDINVPLPAGTTLTLPADATVGRRAAR